MKLAALAVERSNLNKHTPPFSVIKRKPQQAKHKYQTVLPEKADNLCNKSCFCSIHRELTVATVCVLCCL